MRRALLGTHYQINYDRGATISPSVQSGTTQACASDDTVANPTRLWCTGTLFAALPAGASASPQAPGRGPAAGGPSPYIGRWLASYAAGGLPALLATYVPAGKAVSLAPAILASLEEALRRPEGFASSEALRQWVRRTHGVEIKDKTL